LGDRWRVASVLDDLAAAVLAGRPSRPAQAARLLGAAEQIRDAIGTAIAPCERADHARTEAAARAALGDAAFADLTSAGAAAPLDDVVAGDIAPSPPRPGPRAGARAPAHFSARRSAPAAPGATAP